MSPKCTIIVTVYKRTQFLRESLQSALSQTFNSFEVIVTDDSESSEIKSICESFCDQKIRYRTNSGTLGVALNLRAAIKESRGHLIAILNDDDVWEPEFLEKMITPLEQRLDVVLSFCDHWIMKESGEVDKCKTEANTKLYERHRLPRGEVNDLESLVLEKNAVPLAMASVFRKDAFDTSLLTKDVGGAYDFWIACLLAASKRPAYYIPERLTRYRIHQTMETARKSPDKSENMVFITSKLIELNAFEGKADVLMRKHSDALYRLGRDRLFFNQVRAARESFVRSLSITTKYKTIISLLISYLPRSLRRVINFTQ